jgi:hypothetical protein
MVTSDAVVGEVGRGQDPSKYFHNSLASTATWKRNEKIAQLEPFKSSFGTLDGRVSVVTGTAIDIAKKWIDLAGKGETYKL